MHRQLSGFWVAGLVACLVACGGGGGGASDNSGAGGGTGTGGAPSAVTGLVPAAPPIGATLFADASALRPIKDGATWSYRGSASAYTGATPVAYLTATTQAASSATTAVEAFTNSGNTGVGSQPIAITNGVVGSNQSVDFAGKGQAQAVNFIELRSPVRQGDQYTIVDQRFTDTAIDADGDGKPDALDVAGYARVIGIETVNLPNLPALQAVRVDTIVLTRVTLSSNGQVSPVVQGSVQTWYVPGIGIVRQSTSLPAGSGTSGVATTDEQLVSWDATTTGFGAMAPVAAVAPASAAAFPNLPLNQATAAVAVGDHALVFTNTNDATVSSLVSVVDLRGKVTSTKPLLPGLRVYGSVVATPDGAALVRAVSDSGPEAYGITRFATDGSLVGAPDASPIDLHRDTHVTSSITSLQAAADGSTLWLLYLRSYVDVLPSPVGAVTGDELVLAAYSLAGAPLGPEMLLSPSGAGASLAVADGQVFVTWSTGSPTYDLRYASATLAGLGTQKVLAPGLPTRPFVTPLRLGANNALVWPAPLGSNFSNGVSGGVLLDATLTPVRAGATFLDEQIPGLSSYDGTMPGAAALGSRLVVTSRLPSQALLWAGDSTTQWIDTIGWLDATAASPLAKTPVKTVRIASGSPKLQLLFADRVLVLGGDYGLTTTVVWLNTGTAP